MKALFLFIFLLITLSLPSCNSSIKSDPLIEVEELIFYHPQKAEIKLDSILQIPHSKESANIKYLQGFLLYQKGQIDMTIQQIDKAQKKFIMNKDKEGQGKCQYVLAIIAEGLGQWEQAKSNYLSAIQLISNNSTYIGLSYFGLARCNYYLEANFANYLIKGKKILEQLNNKELTLYSNYINIILTDNFQKSDICQLHKIIQEYENLKLNNNAAGIYKSISLKYYSYNEIDSAILMINKGINTCSEIFPGISDLPSLHQLKGVMFLKKGKKDSAKYYLNLTLKDYDRYKIYDRKYFAYKSLSKLALEDKNYKEAYNLLNKAYKAENKNKTITKARTAMILESNININQLQNKLLKSDLHKKLFLFTFIFIIIIAIIFIQALIRVNKNNLNQIKNKNNELHRLIASFNEKVLTNKKRENGSKILQDIPKLETLSYQFDECYKETFKLLSLEFPQLSTTECRYALLFSLRYSDETISSILCVQRSTVRKTRQRIREKLQINNVTNLHEHFAKCLSDNAIIL
nr:hypothetical protein [uncultured Carboxylicivirga sp.]